MTGAAALAAATERGAAAEQARLREIGTGMPAAVLVAEFGLDGSAPLATRRRVADIRAAWEAVSVQVRRESELRAERRRRGLRVPVVDGFDD